MFYKFRRKLINKVKQYLYRKNFVKGFHKYDLLLYDTIFPHPLSGFRYEEFKELLIEFKNSKIIVEPLSYPVVNTPVPMHEIHIKEVISKYPFLKNKFQNNLVVNINTKLFYCVFLNIICNNLSWLEKHSIPFIFTLYPGGGFNVNDSWSDERLRRVLKSPQFKKVIVTQLYTKNYLIEKKFCNLNQIEYIFGGVVPQNTLKIINKEKVFYPVKNTFDIVFCAAKYMPKGIDKGYDVFIEMAHLLVKKYDFVRFHVVGGFDEDEIDVTLLSTQITFYGYQNFDDLASIFENMDVIVSPNKPFYLYSGSFDGFPLGTVVEAVLNNVVAIVTDNLHQNTVFVENEEIIIANSEAKAFEKEIEELIKTPDKLLFISKAGKNKFFEIYSNEYQMQPRINILRDEIKNYKK